MSEIPAWAIWLLIVVVALVVGIGIGYLLQGPKTWRPGEVWKLRHDNEEMRLKLAEVGRWVDGHKKTPNHKNLIGCNHG